MTTIAASTTSTTAFTVSADTSGSLVLQTGATPTTALTLDGSQNATLAGPLTVPSVTVPTGTLHGLVLGTAQNSTSGTSIDFTGIPSWVKRITVMFNGVSFAAAGTWRLRVGSGTLSTSGYASVASAVVNAAATSVTVVTDGIAGSQTGAAATVVTGTIVLTNISGNTWVANGVTSRDVDLTMNNYTGSIALAGALDRLSVVATTSTFDAGSINIMYEG
jgi:hypothetical protein